MTNKSTQPQYVYRPGLLPEEQGKFVVESIVYGGRLMGRYDPVRKYRNFVAFAADESEAIAICDKLRDMVRTAPDPIMLTIPKES